MLQGAANQHGARYGPHDGNGLAKDVTEPHGQQTAEDEGGEDPGADILRPQTALAADGEDNHHRPRNGEQPRHQGIDQVVPVKARQAFPQARQGAWRWFQNSQGLFGGDGVGENAYALDLDFADIAVLHPDVGRARGADAGRGPHDDHIAGA